MPPEGMTTDELHVPIPFKSPRLLSKRVWIVRFLLKVFSISILNVTKPPGSSIAPAPVVRLNKTVGLGGFGVEVGGITIGGVLVGEMDRVGDGTNVAINVGKVEGVGKLVAPGLGVGKKASPYFVGTGVNNSI